VHPNPAYTQQQDEHKSGSRKHATKAPAVMCLLYLRQADLDLEVAVTDCTEDAEEEEEEE